MGVRSAGWSKEAVRAGVQCWLEEMEDEEQVRLVVWDGGTTRQKL